MKPHEIIEKVFKDEFGEDWGNELRDFEHGFSDFYNCSIKAVEEALHIADVSKHFDVNDVFAPIEDALYATNSFTTDQARNLAEGIVQYIKDAGFDIIKVDNS